LRSRYKIKMGAEHERKPTKNNMVFLSENQEDEPEEKIETQPSQKKNEWIVVKK